MTSSRLAQTATPVVYREGEGTHVGYPSYRVHGSEWRSSLSRNPYLNAYPDAAFLFIRIGMINQDHKERTVPPFKLVDEAGREYGESDKAWRVEGSMGVIQNLNPGVQKDVYLVFDVPDDRHYKLKVSGGYWSSETALIALNPRLPEAPRPSPPPKARPKKASASKAPPQASPSTVPRTPGLPSEDPSLPWACNKATYDARLCAEAMQERQGK